MSHPHSKVTSTLNEDTATALISMEGRALFCFTEQASTRAGFYKTHTTNSASW
ncbi:MAG: hypothetical protein LC803_22970 [Acidobacteria bacterium]|nr:hypothetical protein [Acidobacteriota bacterium]